MQSYYIILYPIRTIAYIYIYWYTNIDIISSSLTLPRTWGQECKSRPGQWPRLGTEPADTRIHLHQWMLSSERKKKKRKKLKRRKKSIEEDSNMAKFAWKIERWWSKDRCITPADTRQWWNFEKKYFVLRRWKRNYWGCLPRGGLVAVFLTNRIFRATVSTVHNVLFAQFEFLRTLPTLANHCQKIFFNQSHFRGKSVNSSEDV